jgi:hypothetical protein
MADPRITQIIRGAGGIVHSDGNIFFTNQAQFLQAATQAQQPAQQAWPKASVVGRKDDMSPDDTLTLCLDGDNDVIVTVREGKRLSSSVEFCNGGGGGGASPRTRAALIALMVAMEADNATRPDRASGIALPPPRSQVQGGLSTDRHTS